jgi:hypothetical protein
MLGVVTSKYKSVGAHSVRVYNTSRLISIIHAVQHRHRPYAPGQGIKYMPQATRLWPHAMAQGIGYSHRA